jgi:hypothetical protein
VKGPICSWDGYEGNLDEATFLDVLAPAWAKLMLPSGYGALRTVVRARCVSSGAFRCTRAKLCLVPLCAVCCFQGLLVLDGIRCCPLMRTPSRAQQRRHTPSPNDSPMLRQARNGVANALKLTAPLVNLYRMTGDWHGYDCRAPRVCQAVVC